ncbi:MAG: hypothetical protein ABWY78_16935 [Microvirga sp.]
MTIAGTRRHQSTKPPRYRLEPLQECRLAAALVLLLSFATVSVLAGTEASRQITEAGASAAQR